MISNEKGWNDELPPYNYPKWSTRGEIWLTWSDPCSFRSPSSWSEAGFLVRINLLKRTRASCLNPSRFDGRYSRNFFNFIFSPLTKTPNNGVRESIANFLLWLWVGVSRPVSVFCYAFVISACLWPALCIGIYYCIYHSHIQRKLKSVRARARARVLIDLLSPLSPRSCTSTRDDELSPNYCL
jgi:hypothetical protein